jgi:Rieske Fe-S protein
MVKPSISTTRRAVVVGGLALAACGVDASTADAGGDCSTAEPDASWVEVPLTELPGVELPGGSALLSKPEALLYVWVLHLADGCFTSIWSICTHGACQVAPADGGLSCPCHGSRFDLTGAVLQGPAPRALRSFPTVLRGTSVFIKR